MNLMNKKIVIAVVALAIFAAGVGFGSKFVRVNFGAINVEQFDPNIMANGYNSAKPITLSGADGDITTGDDLTVTDDVTVSGGSLSVTTTNAATSTVAVGCVQTVATSTQTPIALAYLAVATATTNMVGGQTNNGFVVWKYGSCPF